MGSEIIINDINYRDFIYDQIVDGEHKARGLKPRDFSQYPVGCYYWAKPFDLPLIPESEWQSRLDAQVAAHAQLSDIRNQGMNGQPIPSRDQNGKGFCHVDDTEVLTSNGFVFWPDYNWIDPLGTINPITHKLEFQLPIQKHIYEYDGEIIYSTNRRLDFGVTPDHEMLVRKWDEKKRTLSNTYTSQKAGSLGWYAGFMHAPKGYIGTEIVKIKIEGDKEYNGNDFFAILALITSDGWAGGAEKNQKTVSFANFREECREEISALAYRNGFYEQPARRGVWFKQNYALADWVRYNCYTGNLRAQNKKIPDIVKCASEKQIKHFLNFFDDQNHGEDSQEVFYSSSRKMIDDLQELLLKIGKRGTITNRGSRSTIYKKTGKVISGGPSYQLCVSETDRLCIEHKKHIETDHYKGLVYCAGVPNHTLLTRRNGSVLLSKNCWAHSSVSAALILRALNNQPYADLSAYAIACIIKDYRDEGGWGAESLEWIAENGVPTSKTWPQQSMSRSNDNATMRAEAAQNKVTEWMDLDPDRNIKAQLVTCLLVGIPVVVDYNWWSHSVMAMDLVSLSPFQIRIWNSWGDSWSSNGTGILSGNKAIPDGAIAPRVIGGSTV